MHFPGKCRLNRLEVVPGVFPGYFYRKANLFFPAGGIPGLGLMLFPDYNTKRRARGEDQSQVPA
ncbi:hypothetical protein L0128_08310 [candidate division KSB1 bacterium]|nr:hypothetical protein [candidate division KSB1 bacterium]